MPAGFSLGVPPQEHQVHIINQPSHMHYAGAQKLKENSVTADCLCLCNACSEEESSQVETLVERFNSVGQQLHSS